MVAAAGGSAVCAAAASNSGDDERGEHAREVRSGRTNAGLMAHLVELLRSNDAGAFTNDDELIGGDVRDGLRRAVRPADRQVRGRRGAEAEMQTAIVGGVEARLRGDFLRLRRGRRTAR